MIRLPVQVIVEARQIRVRLLAWNRETETLAANPRNAWPWTRGGLPRAPGRPLGHDSSPASDLSIPDQVMSIFPSNGWPRRKEPCPGSRPSAGRAAHAPGGPERLRRTLARCIPLAAAAEGTGRTRQTSRLLLFVAFLALDGAGIIWHLNLQQARSYEELALQGNARQTITVASPRKLYSEQIVSRALTSHENEGWTR